jgi:hypothetical protein
MKTKKTTTAPGLTCGVTSSASLNGETVQNLPATEGMGQSIVINHINSTNYEEL